jgi:hypothetical protein
MSDEASAASKPGKFKLKYAPKITAFKRLVGSSDAIDNIKFCADYNGPRKLDHRIR